MMKRHTFMLAAALAALAAPASANPEIERFYQGKRMQVIVGRALAADTTFTPGTLRAILAVSFRARQSSLFRTCLARAASWARLRGQCGAEGWHRDRRDATRGAAHPVMGQQGARFKASELQWLASLSSEPGVCAVATRTGVNTLEEMLQKAAQHWRHGPNITEFHPAMFNNLMGGRFRLVKGYTTTQQVHLAIERGEADAICQSWASYKPQAEAMAQQKLIRPIVQMSLKPDPEMTKLGLPLIFDRINDGNVGKGFTAEQVKGYFTLLIATGYAGRPFFFAPEVPKERVAALREAFAKMVVDPEFVAEAEKQKRDIDYVSGEELQNIMVDLGKTPADMLSKLDGLMQYKDVK